MGEMAEWSMTDHPDDNDYPEKEPMTDKRLEEIRERLKNVTSGKWKYYGDWGGDAPECFVEAIEQSTAYPFVVADFDFGNSISQETPEQVDNDGEFIAHAPEDIRALLDLVDTQAKRLKDGREIAGDELDMRQVQLAFAKTNAQQGVTKELEKRIAILDAWLRATKKRKPSVPPFVDC